MSRRSHFPARLFTATMTTVALVAAGLAMPITAQAASFDVDTAAEFESAFEDPAGADIRLTGSIDAHTGSFQQADGFTVSVDLNGFDLSVNSLVGGDGSFLLLTDSTVDGGTLTATATYGLDPAIFTALGETRIDGTIRVEATGTVNQPGIGGSTNGLDPKHDGGSIIIGGNATVVAVGGSSVGTASPAAAGIGGSQTGRGPNLRVEGSAVVAASAGFADSGQRSGAGIGGGVNGDGNYVDIRDNAQVTAIGRNGGAGIGSGAKTSQGFGGGTVLISGNATVTARTEGLDPDGYGGAGIGGGSRDLGATVTVSGSAVVDASGGYRAAAIGGGYAADGKSFVSSGSSSITTKSSINAIGYGLDAVTPTIGTVTIGAGSTVTVPPNSQVNIPSGQQITNNGTIVSNHVLAGAGKIVNNGTIINQSSLAPSVPITNHNYQVQLEATPGDLPSADAIQRVYAASPAASHVALPTPTRPGYSFVGWNTNADGTGVTITDSSDITGLGSSTGNPIIGVLFAQYEFIKLSSAVTVSTTPGVLTAGEAASASASVPAAASGTISFSVDGAAPFATAAAPTATVAIPGTLSVGSHTVTATYSGDATYLPSSGSSALMVNPVAVVVPPPVVVPPVVTTVTPKVTVTAKKFAKNSKPKVTVTISVKATGKVAVYVGKKKVKTVTVTNKKVLRVTLPKKYSKTISVKAKFLGSATVAAATSKSVKLRVK